MPELIGFRDGGSTIIHLGGRPHNIGVVVLRVSVNEAKPIDIMAHCRLVYKDSIIKNLKRLATLPPQYDTRQHRPKIDREEYIEALEYVAATSTNIETWDQTRSGDF